MIGQLQTEDWNQSPGPLMTRNQRFDFVLGFLSEITTVALFAYFLYLVGQILSPPEPLRETLPRLLLLAGGAVATILFMITHTRTMRDRYPVFAQGWSAARHQASKGLDHLYTLVLGCVVLFVLFPIGLIIFFTSLQYGWIGGTVGFLLAYFVGTMVRRTYRSRKRPGGLAP